MENNQRSTRWDKVKPIEKQTWVDYLQFLDAEQEEDSSQTPVIVTNEKLNIEKTGIEQKTEKQKIGRKTTIQWTEIRRTSFNTQYLKNGDPTSSR